jgi:hypothetical protein
MSQQEKYMREMEGLLQREKEERELMREEVDRLNKKVVGQGEELAALEKERERLA